MAEELGIMEAAEEELERRSKFLKGLILKKKAADVDCDGDGGMKVSVRTADMPLSLQNHAFEISRTTLLRSPSAGVETKRLALALKKEFDSKYGPAWNCVVGTSFGSYVTHSAGGFLYFSIDKLCVLLFRTPARAHRR